MLVDPLFNLLCLAGLWTATKISSRNILEVRILMTASVSVGQIRGDTYLSSELVGCRLFQHPFADDPCNRARHVVVCSVLELVEVNFIVEVFRRPALNLESQLGGG